MIASDAPLWRSIVESYRRGILIDPLIQAPSGARCRWVLAKPAMAEVMGQGGQMAVRSIFNWEAETGKLNNPSRVLEQ